MTFALPLALLGLLPWAAAAGYVWVRRDATTAVPFVRLWSDRPAAPAGRRATRRPPAAVLLLLAAAVLAVLGASGPSAVRRGGRTGDAARRGPTLVRLAVRLAPSPDDAAAGAAMVRVADLDRPATIAVMTAGRTVRRRLGPGDAGAGGSADTFVDLPAVGPTVRASLEGRARQALTVDRPAGHPRVVAAGDLPGDLPAAARRMVEVYGGVRPAGPSATEVRVVPAAADLPADRSGVVTTVVPDRVGPVGVGATVLETSVLETPVVVDHPLTRGVQLPALRPDAVPTGEAPPGEGWTPLVTVGGRVVLAAGGGPTSGGDRGRPRRAWVGLTAGEWAAWGRTADLVAWFGRAFDWAGGVDPATVGVSAADAPDEPVAPDPPPVDLAPALLLAATLVGGAGVLLLSRG